MVVSMCMVLCCRAKRRSPYPGLHPGRRPGNRDYDHENGPGPGHRPAVEPAIHSNFSGRDCLHTFRKLAPIGASLLAETCHVIFPKNSSLMHNLPTALRMLPCLRKNPGWLISISLLPSWNGRCGRMIHARGPEWNEVTLKVLMACQRTEKSGRRQKLIADGLPSCGHGRWDSYPGGNSTGW